jgi:hypothetical protein
LFFKSHASGGDKNACQFKRYAIAGEEACRRSTRRLLEKIFGSAELEVAPVKQERECGLSNKLSHMPQPAQD